MNNLRREGLLGVHIIGPGFGETVVIEMPGGRVATIDCYSPSLSFRIRAPWFIRRKHPVLRFLRHHLRAKKLAFLAFTHPHEDHGRGLSHVLTDFRNRIDQICCFYGLEHADTLQYLRRILHAGQRLPIEKMLNEPAGTFAQEMLSIVEKALEAGRSATYEPVASRGYIRVPIHDEPVTIHILGPSGWVANDYGRKIALFLQRGIELGEAANPYVINHNLISAAFLIEYGDTRIVLGGDMETAAWTHVLDDQRDHALHRPDMACQLVKVSHHGSDTGYSTGLCERLAARAFPIGVVTPFSRHAHPLPNRRGCLHLQQYMTLFTTNYSAAAQSIGLPLARSRGLPVPWLDRISIDPGLAGLIDPALIDQDLPVSRPVALPFAWIEDIKREPDLANCLRSELRQGVTIHLSERTEHKHRLSFYFDGSGRIVECYRGIGTGELETL